jgi:hypothetical protein
VLIVSADTDFIQLHQYPGVVQYDPIHKKWITDHDPIMYLKEHILEGDRVDGIPNVFSDDDCFVTDKRQRRLTANKKQIILENDYNIEAAAIELQDNSIIRNFHRNV